jgi:dolichol-phosphate mannosyltransferase
MDRSAKKTLAIVVPCYCEAGNIEHFYEVLAKTIEQETKFDWKILFVDDGSHDNTSDVMEKIVDLDNRAMAVILARNFGKEAALMAGVQEALPCDAVICIDADLQHPPSLIPQLLEKWEDGWPVVATVRKSVESHSIFRKIGSGIFYRLMRNVGGNLLIPKSTDFRLIDRFVIDRLLELKENITMFRGMIDWFGFPTAIVHFEAPERYHGTANYSYGKLFQLALTSITSFSLWPLRLTGYAGLVIVTLSSISLSVSFALNFIKVAWFISPLALVVLFNTLLVGILMMCLGLIALYIGNIRDSVLRRPDFVVYRRVRKSNTNSKKHC